MRRIGHRGAMGHAPENTVASFEKAIALGCDEVETDVWLTADGLLLISHDRPGDGTTLTLDAVLDVCRGRLGVNVELKADRDEQQAAETGRRVARRLAERSDPDAYLSSFWWSALVAAQDAAPEVRRAFVFSDSPDRDALIASARSAGLWALHPNRAYVTRELVSAAHAAGLRVNVWTVDDPDEIAACVSLGVDGIMSNRPERIPKG
ncbi:MAG TPA: glycerophosphodiester phosphodiesterase [Candidatus Saccharimonadales bacterium]|jgi:glycerophosphoryl diester phosphodiesterase|nr:glycerophosphodiester phosphodiesterase [Candidatus Saccharimonadales bacterium]